MWMAYAAALCGLLIGSAYALWINHEQSKHETSGATRRQSSSDRASIRTERRSSVKPGGSRTRRT